jgi:hypothetical protein
VQEGIKSRAWLDLRFRRPSVGSSFFEARVFAEEVHSAGEAVALLGNDQIDSL